MKTKKRVIETKESQAPPVSEGKQLADDQTALDEVEKRKKKGKKEKFPNGFKHRLPSGKTRTLSVNKKEIGKENGKPFRIEEVDEDDLVDNVSETDIVEIEGGCRLIHETRDVCGDVVGKVYIETEASILVGNIKIIFKA